MNDFSLATKHFKDIDPVMYELSLKFGSVVDVPKLPIAEHAYLARLCRTVAGQQLSVKAAATIWERVCALCRVDIDEAFADNVFDKVSDEELRACGLSYQKIGYLRAITAACKQKSIDLVGLKNMSDQKAISELTTLKGIGVWSAEMFLMSALARPDIFSTGDLGLVTAVEKHYHIDRRDKQAIASQIKPLAPHRTVASLLLWSSLDNTPT